MGNLNLYGSPYPVPETPKESHRLPEAKEELKLPGGAKVRETLENITPTHPNTPLISRVIQKDMDGYSLKEDIELAAGLTNLAKAIVPIPVTDPFYSTDVIVFNDNYNAELPNNGIRESEWKEATHWLSELKTKGSIGSLNLSENPGFREKMINAIVQLCRREGTRDLVRMMISLKQPVYIQFAPGWGAQISAYDNEGKNALHLIDPDFSKLHFVLRIDPDYHILGYIEKKMKSVDDRTLERFPLHITLGHEFLHIAHAAQNFGLYAMRSLNARRDAYDYEEEFQTIQGPEITWDERDTEPLQDDEDWTDSETIDPLDYLSENCIRASFSGFPRYGHRGTPWKDITSEMAIDLMDRRIKENDLKGVIQLLTDGWANKVGQSVEQSMFTKFNSLFEYQIKTMAEAGLISPLKELINMGMTHPFFETSLLLLIADQNGPYSGTPIDKLTNFIIFLNKKGEVAIDLKLFENNLPLLQSLEKAGFTFG